MKQKSSQNSFFEPLQKHVLRISKGPIESVFLIFINIHYSYRIWVPALMLIRLFQFCNPFPSCIMNTGLGPPSVTVRVFALTSINAASVPKAFTLRKQKEVCRSPSPAITYKGYRGSRIPIWARGAFLHGCGRRAVDKTKVLGSHSVFAHCSCCQFLTKFIIPHVNHFHACFVLIDSSISTRLEHCRVCSFGKLCCCCHSSRTHF